MSFNKNYKLSSHSNRILLVVPAIDGDPFLNSSVNLGLGYVGASLLSKGHLVKLTDMTFYKNYSTLSNIIRNFEPEIIGVTGSTFHYSKAIDIISHLKKTNHRIITVLGGTHASAVAEFILSRERNIDFIIKGEGESAFPALLKSLYREEDPCGIPGLVYRSDGIIKANQPSYIKNIDELEYPWKIIYPFD